VGASPTGATIFIMRTETLAKMLMQEGNLFERTVEVRLNGKMYAVSHVEHKDDTLKEVIVICDNEDD
jgi:hypothetical protein